VNRVVAIACALAVAGVLFLAGPPKSIPGGPYFSVVGEVIPATVCIAALAMGVASIRKAAGGMKIGVSALLLAATVLLAAIVERVILFWFDPHARGALFG
jgi:hypothetical protein